MEPFVFFEFMEITPKKKLDKLGMMGEAGKKARTLNSPKAMGFAKAAGGQKGGFFGSVIQNAPNPLQQQKNGAGNQGQSRSQMRAPNLNSTHGAGGASSVSRVQ